MCVIDEPAPEMREISANIQISIENCVECRWTQIGGKIGNLGQRIIYHKYTICPAK